MTMPVMNVRKMRMRVRERDMLVRMRVRLLSIPGELVRVLVMRIVIMRRRMQHRLVCMRVVV